MVLHLQQKHYPINFTQSPLCLGNVSKDFTINNMKTGSKGVVIFLSADFNTLMILTIF